MHHASPKPQPKKRTGIASGKTGSKRRHGSGAWVHGWGYTDESCTGGVPMLLRERWEVTDGSLHERVATIVELRREEPNHRTDI